MTWRSNKSKTSKKSIPTKGLLASRYHSAYRDAVIEKARIDYEDAMIAEHTGQPMPAQHIWQLGGLPVFKISPVLPKVGKWHMVNSPDDVRGEPLTEPIGYGPSDYYHHYKDKPITELPKDIVTRPFAAKADVFNE